MDYVSSSSPLTNSNGIGEKDPPSFLKDTRVKNINPLIPGQLNIISLRSWPECWHKYADQNYRPEDSVCIYLRLSKNKKLRAWYNFLPHADNRRYFPGLSLTRNRREAHVLFGEESGKSWTCSWREKGNFIMINELKYGQTWKIWPSPLSFSLYNPFKVIFK